uniref:GPI-anchored protein LLG1-like n=1 Tax=Erigeron canadensis TaxID=72917 RepID=UPI001CB88DA0|nr:GPI-anchored protein LLG1-like [Erigeron canadensis]
MRKKIVISFLFLFCFFISSTCFSSPLLISDGVFFSSSADSFYSSFGRALLEKKKACPEDFKNMNYTVITSQCKEPYDNKTCCDAFKHFTCPYVSELNDDEYDCADTLYKYLRRNFTQGFFAKACNSSRTAVGVECPDTANPPEAGRKSGNDSNNSRNIRSPSLLLTLAMGFIIF